MPETTNLIATFTAPLDELGVAYMVTGSVASSLYGEPRLTHDIDIVADLARGMISAFLARFPLGEFYAPPEETVLEEVLRPTRGHFNLLHHRSGFKADIYLAGADEMRRWGLGLRRRVALDDTEIWMAPPEYVILRKLEFFREGGSQKHLRDVRKMLETLGPDLDVPEITRRAAGLGLADLWASARSG